MLETRNRQLGPSKKIEVKGNDGYLSCKLVYYSHLLLTAELVWCYSMINNKISMTNTKATIIINNVIIQEQKRYILCARN